MASAEEHTEPQLKYQTLNLKVSIHCEGCKKKVKKVLQTIDGVYKTTIDSQHHKVTVIGNVAADILIKKLLRTGKHAELWPEEKKPKPNTTDTAGEKGTTTEGAKKKKKKKNKKAAALHPTDKNTPPPAASDDDSSSDTCESPDADPPEKPKDTASAPPPEKAAGAVGGAVSAGSGKKKGKKGGGGGGEEAAAAVPGGNSVAVYPAPAAAYVLSYNTAHPSYGGAVAAYLPVEQSRYMYSMQPGTYYIPTAAAGGSYEVFSEENANACCIM